MSPDSSRAPRNCPKQKDVKTALSRERAEDDAEARQVGDVFALEAGSPR
jgi:hypothetical protein